MLLHIAAIHIYTLEKYPLMRRIFATAASGSKLFHIDGFLLLFASCSSRRVEELLPYSFYS